MPKNVPDVTDTVKVQEPPVFAAVIGGRQALVVTPHAVDTAVLGMTPEGTVSVAG